MLGQRLRTRCNHNENPTHFELETNTRRLSPIFEEESFSKNVRTYNLFTVKTNEDTISIDDEKLIQSENQDIRRQKFKAIFVDSPIKVSFLRTPHRINAATTHWIQQRADRNGNR